MTISGSPLTDASVKLRLGLLRCLELLMGSVPGSSQPLLTD